MQWDVLPSCLYEGFPGNQTFNLDGSRASLYGLKQRSHLTVCLNLTAIQKFDTQYRALFKHINFFSRSFQIIELQNQLRYKYVQNLQDI